MQDKCSGPVKLKSCGGTIICRTINFTNRQYVFNKLQVRVKMRWCSVAVAANDSAAVSSKLKLRLAKGTMFS